MSDELEDRLRSSLRAYAELVEAPDAADLPARATAAGTPRSALRRWRGAGLLAAAAAAVVSGSLWLVSGIGEPPVASSSAGSADASTAAGSAAGQARSDASAAGLPESDTFATAEAPSGVGMLTVPAAPEVGVAYPFDLFTHCGVVGADIGGAWFAAEPPLLDGPGNPPPGWGNPYQRGTLTLLNAGEAVFADGVGHQVRLRAADEAARPTLCE